MLMPAARHRLQQARVDLEAARLAWSLQAVVRSAAAYCWNSRHGPLHACTRTSARRVGALREGADMGIACRCCL